MDPRTAIFAIVIMLFVGLAGAVVVQTERVDSLERMLTESRAENGRLSRSITELAVERVAAEIRSRRAADAREAILMAPPEEDGPVSTVLRRALVAADEIGGLQ